MFVCMCVCVCVCEKRETDRQTDSFKLISHLLWKFYDLKFYVLKIQSWDETQKINKHRKQSSNIKYSLHNGMTAWHRSWSRKRNTKNKKQKKKKTTFPQLTFRISKSLMNCSQNVRNAEIHLFFIQLCINSRANLFFRLVKATSLRKGIL